jgi:anaphase-promoting complex subunit 5
MSNESIDEALREALPLLETAENEFYTLQMLQQVMDVQYYLAVAYENLGQESERDQMVKKHFATEKERKRLEVQTRDQEVATIWQLVSDVGAALSGSIST